MELSDFGRKMSADVGILQLMDDLGNALAGEKPKAMPGGGNPAQIPAVTDTLKQSTHELLNGEERVTAIPILADVVKQAYQ